MKTTINKIYAFIAMCLACIPMLFTSCESLDQYPEDYFTGQSFWKDNTQVDGYMKGLHSYLRGTYSSLFNMGEATVTMEQVHQCLVNRLLLKP